MCNLTVLLHIPQWVHGNTPELAGHFQTQFFKLPFGLRVFISAPEGTEVIKLMLEVLCRSVHQVGMLIPLVGA